METSECAELVNKMWAELGTQIKDAVPDIVIGGKPEEAIRWACCAEACFWKATGESETHDVKDVVAPRPAPEAS